MNKNSVSFVFWNEVKIGPTEKILVSDVFFRPKNEGGLPIYISREFNDWILKDMVEKKLSLENQIKGKIYRFFNDAHDSDIDRKLRSGICLTKFLPMISLMINLQKKDERKGPLEPRFYNLFRVKLSDGMVTAFVYFDYSICEWCLDASGYRYDACWPSGSIIFKF